MPSFYWKWLLLIQALLSAADLDRLNQCFLSMLFFCCPLAPFYWDKKAKSRGRRGWGSSHCSSVMWTLCEVCSVCMCIPLSFYWPSSRETTRAGGERMVWLEFTKSQWEHQAVRWLHGEGEQQTTHHTTPQGFNWMVQTDLWLKKIVSKFTMSISLHAPLNYFSHHKVCLNVFLFNLFIFFYIALIPKYNNHPMCLNGKHHQVLNVNWWKDLVVHWWRYLGFNICIVVILQK